MINRLLSLVAGKPDGKAAMASLVLPIAVGDAIDGASIVVRAPRIESHTRQRADGTIVERKDYQPRVVVQVHGWNGWLYSDEDAAKFFARAYPGLNERQLAQAVNRTGARVRAHLRRLELSDPTTPTPWRDRW